MIEKKNDYILLKHHKPNFLWQKQSMLINTSKTELGIIFS